MKSQLYELTIMEWPNCRGVGGWYRQTYWDTPDEARAHGEAQTEPFHKALLAKLSWTDDQCYLPCDWQGRIITSDDEPWPAIRGSNGEHPAYLALRADWPHLVAEVRRRRRMVAHKGTIEIASELIAERHPTPGLQTWAEAIGYEAATGRH